MEKIFFWREKCSENKNPFQGPSLQASLGVSRNKKRAGMISNENPNV